MKLQTIIPLLLLYSAANADSYEKLNYVKKVDNLKITNKKSEYTQYLFLNNKKIKTPADFDVISLVGKASINNLTTYVLWGGCGGTADNDSNIHYFFLTIDSNNKSTVSGKHPEAYDDQISIESGLINVKYHNDKPYSDANDFGSYYYNPITNKITLIQATKSDTYYKNKFAKLTPKKIIDQIESDECLSIYDNQLSFSHACGYGHGYCYMFKSLKNPTKDQYYDLLARSCN